MVLPTEVFQMAKKQGIKLTGGHLALIVACVILLFAGGFLSLGVVQDEEPQGGDEDPITGDELVNVNKPIQFSVIDPLGGASTTGASLYVYDTNKVLRETVSYSNGVWKSAMPYESGKNLYVKAVAANFTTRWFEVSVPQMTPADAQASTVNFMEVPIIKEGTWSIKLTDQLGNVYNSGDTLDFSNLSVSTVTLTVMVYNSVDNTGYVVSHDQLNNIDLGIAMLTNSTGSDVLVQGAGSSMSRGSQTYWAYELNADGVTKQLVGSHYVKSGIATMSIQIGEGSLTATQFLRFSLMSYFDTDYFMDNGIGGPDASAETTFNLILSA